MDKLGAMHVFLEIASRGSLIAAADELGVSGPTVGRALAGLERALGVRLINRTTRTLSLTEEGRVYLAHARRILEAVHASEHALDGFQAQPRWRIQVTAPVRFGELCLMPAMADLLATDPRLEVKLVLLDRVVDIVEEGFDVAIRIAPLVDSSLVARVVGRSRRVVCAAPSLIERLGIPKRPEALEGLPCVRFTGLVQGGHWSFADTRVAVSGPLLCNHAAASLDAVRAGLGFGLFPCYQVMPSVRRGELVLVLEDFEPPAVPVSVMFPHSRLLSERVRVFVDWAVRVLPGELDGGGDRASIGVPDWAARFGWASPHSGGENGTG